MPVRIVVVDDHKILRDALRLLLQRDPDFTVVGDAADAPEAYVNIGQTLPDVVILDLNLPTESGLVVTARIRAQWPQIKIIMLTGDVAAAAAHDALLAGANGFLRKEDASEELIRAIRTVITNKTYLSPDAATAVTQAILKKPDLVREPPLTERELSVLKGLADGLSYKEIAAQLHVSAKSVETYRARLAKKTGISTRAELVRYAIRKGIIAP